MSRLVVQPEGRVSGEKWGVGNGLVAQVIEGELVIEKSGEMIFSGSAECLYEIHRTPGKIEVRCLVPPRGKSGKFIGWLCGAPYMAQVSDETAYKKKVKSYRKKHHDVEVWENSGEGWKFYWARKRNDHSAPFCVAFIIEKGITVDEILKMLPMMRKAGYPDDYIQKLLKERYGVEEKRFLDAIKDSDL